MAEFSKKENTNEIIFKLLCHALWNMGTATANREVYEEMKAHAIVAIPAPILGELSLQEELYAEWKKAIVRQCVFYNRLLGVQGSLPITLPYTVLKGTSAAQYYPFPEYRAQGDIDIMTRREDFEAACQMLLDNGFIEIPNKTEYRHREFARGKIVVEVHLYFASLNNPEQAKFLDELIIDHITTSHILPDLINGLVLIEHISQHLENGLGLRQIIDWMLFVDKCLPDEKWPEFRELVQKIGLETLTVTATRMCELYLGLPKRQWCADADPVLCRQLMDYIMDSGNFGNKWNTENSVGTKTIVYARSPKALVALLQEKGLENWKGAQKNRVLRPFAWLYQAARYIVKGVRRKNALSSLKTEYETAAQRNKLLDALNARQTPKGVAVYKNGEYLKQ